MKKLSLEMPLDVAYLVIDETTIGVKSSVIALCSDIDRYFRLKLNLNISNQIDEFEYIRVRKEYPYLANMSLEQFNRLLIVFKSIRDINAHLHLRKPIFIDDDIIEYLTYILKPDYSISHNNKLTVYGEAYILYFLSRKYNIFPFVISFYKHQYFEEIAALNGKEKSEYQVNTQHVVQELCGVGKPIYPNNVDRFNYQFMNDLFKKYMTRIIYSIEKCCSKTKKSFDNTWSMAKILNNTSAFDNEDEVFNLIISLRNCWLHGVFLNEQIEIDGKLEELSYKFIFESFTKIKRCLMNYEEEFRLVIDELNDFAISCFNFYVLRLIEVSYKVLDNRLLTEDKIDSRVDNLNVAFERFDKAKLDYYELAGELIEADDIVFKVGASKFADNFPRKTKCYKLNIIKFHSEDGFDVGEYHTDNKELVVASINLDGDYMNEINGRYLSEYSLENETKFGNRISVYDAIM